jgi:hypothetical protein
MPLCKPTTNRIRLEMMPSMPPHPSRSDVQQAAEYLVISELAAQLGVALERKTIDLGNGVAIQADGASADNSVLVEVYAHVGPLKGAHPRKLTADAFKLVWAGSRLGSTKLVLAVVDGDAAAYLRRPKAWLTAALVDNKVDVIEVRLPEAVIANIVAAQKRQFR